MGIFKKYVYTIHEKDAAPMLPIIDISPIYERENCCIPVPMRVDKLINGDLTTFILPDRLISKKINGKIYYLNIRNLIREIVILLINWSKKIIEQKFKKDLPGKRLNQWIRKTFVSKLYCPTISQELGKILQFYFDNVLKSFIDKSDIEKTLNDYADYVIEICKNRIDLNNIVIYVKKNEMEYEILEEDIKKDQYLDHQIKGRVIPIDVLIQDKIKTMKFRPFLIYQDLFETFKFNKSKISGEKMFVSPNILLEKNIISIAENIEDIDEGSISDIYTLQNEFIFGGK